jgi:hypothetical protein
MKGGEINLIVQPLLEVVQVLNYLDWLVNEIKSLLIKLDSKEELLVMLFTKQNNPQAI